MRLTPLLALLLLAGCTATPHGATPVAEVKGPPVPTPVAGTGTTWADGTVLRGTVTIPAGSTVTTAPGATIVAVKGSRLIVAGTLKGSGGVLGGKDWDGLQVARGGRLALTEVAVRGGVTTAEGATATLTGGSITQADVPFDVALGSTLTLKGVKVSDISGVGLVKGTVVADHLTYDKAGHTGIVISGPRSVFRLTDSLLVGDGSYSGDMLNTDDAGELTVTNTEIKGTHCAFHVIGVDQLALSGLKIHSNAYGFMAYGSNPAKTQTITNTDVYDNRDFGLLETPGTVQGRMAIDGGFWGRNGRDLSQTTGKIMRTNAAPRLTG
jgi:hypothetical protein